MLFPLRTRLKKGTSSLRSEVNKFKWELEIEALLLNHIGMQGIPKEKDSSRELFIEAICCFYN